MNLWKRQQSDNFPCWGERALSGGILFLLLATAGASSLVRAADDAKELTLSQFRAQVRGLRPRDDVATVRQEADRVFVRLLTAQGEVAAARQSLDRLSGWSKAASARLAAQHVAPQDVEMLRFAEAKAAARLARLEATHRKVAQEANRFLGRETESPLVALPQRTTPDSPKKPAVSDEMTPSPIADQPAGSSLPPAAASEFHKLQAHWEKELLPQAYELLGKRYQSYLFGGIPLSDLLWLEGEVYNTELQHQSLLVEAAMEAASE